MTARSSLSEAVRAVLRRTIDTYADTPAADSLRLHLERMDEPLRVAIAGKVKAGKSTLLNALVGEEVAATDAGECTRVVTWYRDAPSPRITMHPTDGPPRRLPVARDDGRLAIDLQGTLSRQLDRLVVDWPSRSLRAATLIDTPGIASLSTETSARTGAFLTPEDAPSAVDAVIYLIRHLHAADIRFLESFHDQGIGRANPVNTIAVLSRADEIGAGRIDAMQSAQRIARRYRSDEKLRGLCQTVVPVAGLFAETGRTMRQAEFAALAELARAPRADVESLLLSADRFTQPESDLAPGLSAEARGVLLERFGLFGVRLATTLIRRGFDDPATLAAELVRRSGLDELREVLTSRFTERSDILKARSALLAVDAALRRAPRDAATPLAAEVERIMASAHEFAELRLRSALRSGAVRFPPDVLAEAERLIGGEGEAPPARLGLDTDAGPDELRDGALGALGRWQRRAESPLYDRAAADAARTVVRSCEGLIAGLGQRTP